MDHDISQYERGEIKAVWDKLHSLECKLGYLIDERNSRPEPINSKHAWDMILLYMQRELVDTKEMLKEMLSRDI